MVLLFRGRYIKRVHFWHTFRSEKKATNWHILTWGYFDNRVNRFEIIWYFDKPSGYFRFFLNITFWLGSEYFDKLITEGEILWLFSKRKTNLTFYWRGGDRWIVNRFKWLIGWYFSILLTGGGWISKNSRYPFNPLSSVNLYTPPR